MSIHRQYCTIIKHDCQVISRKQHGFIFLKIRPSFESREGYESPFCIEPEPKRTVEEIEFVMTEKEAKAICDLLAVVIADDSSVPSAK